MGLVRKSRSEIQKIGALRARENIKKAIEKMKMFNRVRVAYFEELLEQSRVEQPKVALKIDRGPNPNLRHVGGAQLALIVDNEKPNQKL